MGTIDPEQVLTGAVVGPHSSIVDVLLLVGEVGWGIHGIGSCCGQASWGRARGAVVRRAGVGPGELWSGCGSGEAAADAALFPTSNIKHAKFGTSVE
jgi:hypothetical protein